LFASEPPSSRSLGRRGCAVTASGIFLSYRRDDSSGYTELLYSRLAGRFGRPAVFRDVHSIQPMDRFREVIDASLLGCAVVVVVISRQWTQMTDVHGARRLMDPDDVVTAEIAGALARGLRVLPVLVGGAKMPGRDDLPSVLQPLAQINALDISDQRLEHDFEQLVSLIEQTVPAPEAALAVNPFSVRGGIRQEDAFFNRAAELSMLRDYVRGRQNCQIVGPRRIGKSSLLLHVERRCAEWCPSANVAYIDLQDPRCYTLKGWLKEVGEGLRLPHIPRSLADLMEVVEDALAGGAQPILCLDEFGEMARRPKAFPREVFLTLRACGQRGMSILTAAPQRLSALTDPRDDTSPFFNTFPILPLRAFAPSEARAFTELKRPGAPEFTERERERILEFAQGLPLALQAACYHVLAARRSSEDIGAALGRAAEDCGRSG
jgi:hypothetical protein